MTLIDKAEALAPCPFCGAEQDDHGDLDHDAYFCKSSSGMLAIGCSRCMCIGAEGHTRAEAIAAWNRRAALPARGVGVPTDEPEAGEIRAVIVNAKWKPCVHGGGWWVAQDADGRLVSLAPDGFAALTPTDAAQAREAALREAADVVDAKLARLGFPSVGGGSREEMRATILALIGEDRT